MTEVEHNLDLTKDAENDPSVHIIHFIVGRDVYAAAKVYSFNGYQLIAVDSDDMNALNSPMCRNGVFKNFDKMQLGRSGINAYRGAVRVIADAADDMEPPYMLKLKKDPKTGEVLPTFRALFRVTPNIF